MRAIIKQRHGGPEVLAIGELPMPQADRDHVVIRVRAFGLNHAEAYVREGTWPFPTKVLGIECAGEVHADASGRFAPGDRVVALMGGMGRTIPGSYEEYVCPPATNVIKIDTSLPWPELAALPESYATAWSALHQNLAIAGGQRLLVRGGTSALGQAAINIARAEDVTVLATTRYASHAGVLERLGATAVIEGDSLAIEPVNAVLDLLGTKTLLGSLKLVRPRGRVCVAGWLAGPAPLTLDPIMDLPSGVQLSLFGSFMYGQPGHSLADVPIQAIVDRAATGVYRAKPVRVLEFTEIVEGHRLLDAGTALGKIVVRV
jgi:NADPH:quinone reductase-like Zn-dependent oxidoreductase